MEKLIEFLLEHIYIVIVVVGFLLSAMRKMKGGGRTMRMPDFGGGDASAAEELEPQYRPRDEEWPPPGRQSSMERPQQPAVVRRTVSSGGSVSVRQQPAREDESYLSERLLEASVPRAAEKRQPGPSAAVSVGKRRVPVEPDAAAMRQAVVWAEILGPPRAKRPWSNGK